MKKEENGNVMIGSGTNAIFMKTSKGKKIFTHGGSRVEAGLTIEESKRKFDDKFDDAFYCKPVAYTKKLIRRIKKQK